MSSSSKQIQSNLSQVLPVSEACYILGKDTVARLVRAYLHFRTPTRPPTNEDVVVILKALYFDPGENDVPQNIMARRHTQGLIL